MLRVSNLPAKISTPWASGVTNTSYRRVPPIPSQIGIVDGAASFNDGFPPKTFTPVAAGGLPPSGADMNGVLYQTTQWDQWYQAGGPISYDSVFQGVIKGYPQEARIRSATTPYLIWQSTIDANMSNPDAGGAGWQTPVFPDPHVGPAGGLSITTAGIAKSPIGANIAFYGNATASGTAAGGIPDGQPIPTPNKWIRAFNGRFSVVNSAYTIEIFSLDDTGNISNVHDIVAAGQVTASGLTSNGDASVTGNINTATLHVTGASTATVSSTHTNGISDTFGISTTGALQGGSSFSPNLDRSGEWKFTVDPTYGTKTQTYRAGGWFDQWNGQTGQRTWMSPSGSAMTLDGAGNFTALSTITGANVTATGTVTGANVTATVNVVATAGLYGGTLFCPNNSREWTFTVNANTDKIETYRGGGWTDVWNGSTGQRNWNAPSGNIMSLDGSGNLTVADNITCLNSLTFSQGAGAQVFGETNTADGGVVGGLKFWGTYPNYMQIASKSAINSVTINSNAHPTGGGAWSVDFNGNMTVAGNTIIYGEMNVMQGQVADFYLNRFQNPNDSTEYWRNLNFEANAHFTYIESGTRYDHFMWGTVTTGAASVAFAMTLDGHGNLGIHGTLVQNVSRATMTDIVPASQGLDVIKQLNPMIYRRSDGKIDIGLIGEDVQDVLPEAIDPLLLTQQPTLGLSYSSVTAVLINAVKDLAGRVSTLEGHA